MDESLRAVIERDVIGKDDVELSFAAPTKDWAATLNKPTINAFLYDIREDTGRRTAGPRPVKDDQGRTLERGAPIRHFRLGYLLTAWTTRPEDEHQLLSTLLRAMTAHNELNEEDLVGSLADSPAPTVLSLALPPGQDRSLSDIWSALGGELKPSLDLLITAPLQPHRPFFTGPPVLETPLIEVGGVETSDDPEDVVTERALRRSLKRRVPVEQIEEVPGGERLHGGVDPHPGRTLDFIPLGSEPTPDPDNDE